MSNQDIVNEVASLLKHNHFNLQGIVPGSRVAVITNGKVLINTLASTNNISVPIQPGVNNIIKIRYAKKNKYYLPLEFIVTNPGTYTICQVLDP